MSNSELIFLKEQITIPVAYSTGPLFGKFLLELRDNKRILGNKCPKCGRIQTPPREICALCRVRVLELVEVGPGGKIANYDLVFYSSPDPASGEKRKTPYCSAFIILDGCGEFDVFWHEINPDHVERLKIGQKVECEWAPNRTGSITDIKYFNIVEE